MYYNLLIKIFIMKLFIILCLHLFACSHDSYTLITPICKNDSLLIVDVDHSVQIESVNYSDFYANVQATILECDTNILIGYIDKLETYNDYLIILDVNYSQGIFVFNKAGKFIHRIGSKGQGVGEYIGVSDFIIDHEGFLYLLDNWSQKINVYELSNGAFVRSLKINENGHVYSYHIYKNSNFYLDSYFLKSLKKAYLFQSLDGEFGYTINQYLDVNDYNKSWTNTRYVENIAFYKTSMNSAFFVQQFMDTIIKIKNDTIYPFAVIKSVNFIAEKDVESIKEIGSGFSAISELFNKDVMWGIRDVRMCDDYLFFRCWEQNMQICILYNMVNKTTYKIMYEKDDLLFHDSVISGVSLKYLCSNRSGSYFCVRTEDIQILIAYAKENMISLPQKQLEEIKALSDDSNPVIIYYEYK